MRKRGFYFKQLEKGGDVLVLRNFDKVGVAFLTKSGKMMRTELNDLPFTVLNHNIYVFVEDVKAVIEGKRENATAYMLKGQERLESCEAHRS